MFPKYNPLTFTSLTFSSVSESNLFSNNRLIYMPITAIGYSFGNQNK